MDPSLPPLALVYHGVADVPLRVDRHRLFVRPDDLRRQLDRLRTWGYRLVTFGELARRVANGEAAGHASLTFDDGLADNLDALVPLLEGEGAPATVFVVTGWLGQEHPAAPWARIVTADEVRALDAAGLEIGAHSVTHPDLSVLSYDGALRELEESKSTLAAMLGRPVEVAAYPYGRATAETIRACRDAGFSAACRISGQGSWNEPLNLPRQDMDNRCTMIGFRLKRDDRYEPLMRRRAARLARSVRRRLRATVG